jgi:hypothetical protein
LHACYRVKCARSHVMSDAPIRACHTVDVCIAGLCTSLISASSTHSSIRPSVTSSACVRACVYAQGRMRLPSSDTQALVRADMLASDSSEHEETVFLFVVEHAVEPDPEPHMRLPLKAQRQGSPAAQPSSQAAGERCQSAPYRVTRSPIALAQAAEPHHMHCSYFHVLCPCTCVRMDGCEFSGQTVDTRGWASGQRRRGCGMRRGLGVMARAATFSG